jgi:uncharacterized protein
MASGRWTLITGASSGIGLELARCFAADGDGLVLTARRKERLDALAAELASRHGIPTRALAVDLEDPVAPESLRCALDADGIALHTLVNNAGFGLLGPFATLSAERQLAMVQVNIAALTALSRMFLPGMIERRQGGILISLPWLPSRRDPSWRSIMPARLTCCRCPKPCTKKPNPQASR